MLTNYKQIKNVMLHFWLEIIYINRSNKTRSLLQDKYDRCHSDGYYRVATRKTMSNIVNLS